jgi:hypothetical protein
MVVNVDREYLGKSFDAGSVEVRALNHKDCVIASVDGGYSSDFSRAGKFEISRRDIIPDDYFSLLSEGPEEPAEGEGRSDSVTVGSDMGGDSKILVLFD